MPQEVISIQNFGGMMTNPHKEDIPDNMAVYAYNLDPQAELGVLRGIEQSGASYTANGSALPDVYEADWLSYEVSGVAKKDLIYIDINADDITAIEDFYAAEASRTKTDLVTSGIVPRCVKTFNNAVQIGNGVDDKANVVYRLLEDKKFFNDLETITAGLQVENAECHNSPITENGSVYVSNAANAGLITGYFQANILYKWATSLIYEGIDESNLIEGDYNVSDTVVDRVRITITAKDFVTGSGVGISLMDSRVTAVNLYRAESSNDSEGNLGLYRLVKTLDINTGSDTPPNITGTADVAVTTTNTKLTDTRLSMVINEHYGRYITCNGKTMLITSNTTDTFTGSSWSGGGNPGNGFAWSLAFNYEWIVNGDDYTITYDDDGSYPDGGATYEENTGVPESLEFQSIRYALNEVGGGFHWVANGEPEGESGTDWQRYLFRSKKFRPNMFDWARDFLVLPEIPTALAWYNDRLYAFSDNTVYRINPELMYIEDTFFGAGASHRQSVLVSEYGLYFCNLNGAYRIQDSGIEVISDPIAELPRIETYLSYKYLASQTASSNFDRIVIKADTDKRLILFVGATSAHATLALGFYIPTGQWYGFGLGSKTLTANSGLYGGKDGEIYISNATASYRLFGHATPLYESTSWVSKEYHLGEPSQNKSWNMVKWDATAGTGTVVVKYSTEGTDPVSGTAATSGSWINIYKKTFQVYLETTGNAVIDSIDIIVRRLFGKR